jgi:hypothetical protein
MDREIRRYQWWIQNGSGEVEIVCDSNADNVTAHAMIERQLSRGVGFGIGYRHYKLLDRRPV